MSFWASDKQKSATNDIKSRKEEENQYKTKPKKKN